jgi:hypothetical protein
MTIELYLLLVQVFGLAGVRRLCHAGRRDSLPLRGAPSDHRGVYPHLVRRGSMNRCILCPHSPRLPSSPVRWAPWGCSTPSKAWGTVPSIGGGRAPRAPCFPASPSAPTSCAASGPSRTGPQASGPLRRCGGALTPTAASGATPYARAAARRRSAAQASPTTAGASGVRIPRQSCP